MKNIDQIHILRGGNPFNTAGDDELLSTPSPDSMWNESFFFRRSV